MKKRVDAPRDGVKAGRSPVPGLVVRREVHRILIRIDGGGHSDALLASAFERLIRSAEASRSSGRIVQDRALLQELVLGTLRRRATLDAALAPFSSRPIEGCDSVVREALRLGAYQILYLDRVPPSAAVDTAVQIVKETAGQGPAAFVNAVLRSLAAATHGGSAHERARFATGAVAGENRTEDPAERLAVVESHPVWFVRRLIDRLGQREAEDLLAAHNRPAPVSIRPSHFASADRAGLQHDLAALLASEGVVTTPSEWVPGALRVTRGAVTRAKAFVRGLFYVQDEASMLVALLATPPPGGRVADLCAAPGGKAFAIAAHTNCNVIACERNGTRLRKLIENARRLAASDAAVLDAIAFLQSDAAEPPFRAESFDVVLLDAACTGTGVIRRHPEIRWRLKEDDPVRMGTRQEALIESAAVLVRPGGALVYAVCSLEPEEGEDVIATFLRGHPEFRIAEPRWLLPQRARSLVSDDGLLVTWPHRHDLDGHFAARMERSP